MFQNFLKDVNIGAISGPMDTIPQVAEAASPLPTLPRAPERVLAELLARQKVLKLATSGGPTSPWITGTYFAEDGLARVFFTLEQRGKGMANIEKNPRVAIAIDGGSPFEAFAQAEGEARIVTGPEADRRITQLRLKIPEIAPLLQGSLHLMEVRITRWLLTSFPDQMFPARELRP